MSAPPPQSPVRWIVAILMVALAGASAFVFKDDIVQASADKAPTITPEEKKLVDFMARGRARLLAGALRDADMEFHKASGLKDSDPRPYAGLADVAAARVERKYAEVVLGAAGSDGQKAALKAFEEAMKIALKAYQVALLRNPPETIASRLKRDEVRLRALHVLAYQGAGDTKRAQDLVTALLTDSPQHPLRQLIQTRLAAPAPPPAASSAAADAGAPDEDAKKDDKKDEPKKKPKVSFSGDEPPGKEKHYEFDNEPVVNHKTPGELTIPAGKTPPAPASPDTTDLP